MGQRGSGRKNQVISAQDRSGQAGELDTLAQQLWAMWLSSPRTGDFAERSLRGGWSRGSLALESQCQGRMGQGSSKQGSEQSWSDYRSRTWVRAWGSVYRGIWGSDLWVKWLGPPMAVLSHPFGLVVKCITLCKVVRYYPEAAKLFKSFWCAKIATDLIWK